MRITPASLLVFLTSAFLSTTVFASGIIDSKNVYSQKDCFGGSYESWQNAVHKKINKKYRDKDKAKQAKNSFDKNNVKGDFYHFKSSLSCNTFYYSVDGNIVLGYAIKPKNYDKSLPVLIYNRGGSGDYGKVNLSFMMGHLFDIAEKRFVIIGSQYRGVNVSYSPVYDQFGGEDVKDVTALLPLIENIQGADISRMGMFGASRGGVQTFLALKQLPTIKAVAVIAGPSDLILVEKHRPEMAESFRRRMPLYEQDRVAELEKRSVIKWVDKLPKKVPVLLLHGTADKRVQVSESINLADALEKLGHPHKLVIYPDDSHGLSANRKAAHQEIVSWFKQYL